MHEGITNVTAIISVTALVCIACVALWLSLFSGRQAEIKDGGLSVSLQVPAKSNIGETMNIQWEVNGVSENASMGLFLERDAPEEDTYKYFGGVGPLDLTTLNLEPGHNKGVFKWDGISVGCDPTDFPTFCKSVEPGEYTIAIVVYDGVDVPLVLGNLIEPYVYPETIARSVSNPFTLEGEEDISRLREMLLEHVHKKVYDYMGVTNAKEELVGRYLQITKDVYRKEKKLYCMELEATVPLQGSIVVCSPNITTDESMESIGEITYKENTMSYAQASELAVAVVHKMYRSRVKVDGPMSYNDIVRKLGYKGVPEDLEKWLEKNPDATSYLGSGISNWVYRAEEDYWLLKVFAVKVAGFVDGPDRFFDQVLVRVDSAGETCVIETAEYDSITTDMFKKEIVCDITRR